MIPNVLLVAVFTTVCLTTLNGQVTCPNGWIVYNQFCYYVGRNPKIWAEARDYCVGLGGLLWYVDSMDEFNAIAPMATKGMNNWMGLGNHGYTGYNGYSWEGPTQFGADALPWLNKSPLHGFVPGGVAECVAMYGAADLPSTYTNFFACGNLFHFICKRNGGNGPDGSNNVRRN